MAVSDEQAIEWVRRISTNLNNAIFLSELDQIDFLHEQWSLITLLNLALENEVTFVGATPIEDNLV